MRFDGKLEKWNDGRGFGFIMPQRGGDPVFVHISAFPSDGRRPRIGEILSFEVEPAADGKRRAVNVQRPGHKQLRATHALQPHRTGWRARFSSSGLAIAAVLLVVAVYAYIRFPLDGLDRAANRGTPATLTSAPTTAPFQCDGRTRCTQMTSCEEAKFFLTNCPDVQMDGDYNGIPCEAQWCRSGGRP